MILIEVCLASYNGGEYIEEFLTSLCGQTFKDFHVIVSDDGSTDNTLDIIERFTEILNITIISNKEAHPLGPAKNFMYLLEKASGTYLMLADQDDVWHNEKISSHLDMMRKIEQKDSFTPGLVFSDYSLADKNLDVLSLSGLSKIGGVSISKMLNSFEYTNYIPGCTMMINRRLVDLAINYQDKDHILMHDWWLTLIAKYNGGRFGYIKKPLVMYRQHPNNVVGASKNISAATKIINFVHSPRSKLSQLKKQFRMVKAAGYSKSFLSFLVIRFVRGIIFE